MNRVPVIANDYPGLKAVIENNQIGACVSKVDLKDFRTALDTIIQERRADNITKISESSIPGRLKTKPIWISSPESGRCHTDSTLTQTNKPSPTFMNTGSNPFTRDAISDSIDTFLKIYGDRPILNNHGGMKSPHLFATWFMARTINPKTIIESGVWKGLGTWILEQACPEAEIHSLDLNLSKREYISDRAIYHECDFSELDYTQIDISDCMAFFDDHQNALTRMQQCLWIGIKDIIFEDNYDPGSGDFYSIRMILEGSGFAYSEKHHSANRYNSTVSRTLRKMTSLLKTYGFINGPVIPQYSRDSIPPNRSDAHLFSKNITSYNEFPPLCEAPSRKTEEPLLNGRVDDKYAMFECEADNYNAICHIKLR